MTAPTVKKGTTTLISTDACPRCTHLISSHDDNPPRCTASAVGVRPAVTSNATTNRCGCVPQDVHATSK